MTVPNLTDREKIDLVLAMFAAWERKDWHAVALTFTEDGIFHNIMLEPTVGRDAIEARLSRLRVAEPNSVLEMTVRHIGVIDGLVFVERFDSWKFDDIEGGIPVVGIFELRGTQIARWREVYDRSSLRREAGYPEGSA